MINASTVYSTHSCEVLLFKDANVRKARKGHAVTVHIFRCSLPWVVCWTRWQYFKEVYMQTSWVWTTCLGKLFITCDQHSLPFRWGKFLRKSIGEDHLFKCEKISTSFFMYIEIIWIAHIKTIWIWQRHYHPPMHKVDRDKFMCVTVHTHSACVKKEYLNSLQRERGAFSAGLKL